MNTNPENTHNLHIVTFTNNTACFIASARSNGVYLNGVFQAGWQAIADFIDYAIPIWNAIGLYISDIEIR